MMNSGSSSSNGHSNGTASMVCLDRRNSLPRTATRSRRCVVAAAAAAAAAASQCVPIHGQLSHQQPAAAAVAMVGGINHQPQPMMMMNTGCPEDEETGQHQHQLATAVSLQYISNYLTPDTLILPERLLSTSAKSCHHHHYHGCGHRSVMADNHQNCKRPETIDAAAAQLEEIIRLCRTLQQQKTYYINNNHHHHRHHHHHHHVDHHSDMDNGYCIGGGGGGGGGCQISARCRCSADCIRYFFPPTVTDQTTATAATTINLDHSQEDDHNHNHRYNRHNNNNEFNGRLKMASTTTVPSLINGGAGDGNDDLREDKCRVLITAVDSNQRRLEDTMTKTTATTTTTTAMVNGLGDGVNRSTTATAATGTPLTGTKSSTTPSLNGINRNRSFKVTALVAKFEQERNNFQQQSRFNAATSAASNGKSRLFRDINVNGDVSNPAVGITTTTAAGDDGNHQTRPSLATSIKTNDDDDDDGTSCCWDSVDDDNNDNHHHHQHKCGRAVAGGVQLPSSSSSTTMVSDKDSTATIMASNIASMAATTTTTTTKTTTTNLGDVVVCNSRVKGEKEEEEADRRPDSLKVSVPPPPPKPHQAPPKPLVKPKPKPPPKPASLSSILSSSSLPSPPAAVLTSPATTETSPLKKAAVVITKDVPSSTPMTIINNNDINREILTKTCDNHLGDNHHKQQPQRCGGDKNVNDVGVQVFADPTASMATNTNSQDTPFPVAKMMTTNLDDETSPMATTTTTTAAGTGCCSQSYCCCCCCGQPAGCNHNLLGIDLTKIAPAAATVGGVKKKILMTPKPKPMPRSSSSGNNKTNNTNGTDIMDISSSVKLQPPAETKSVSSSPPKRGNKPKSLEPEVVVVVKVNAATTEDDEEETFAEIPSGSGSSSSSSGNSSSDEGIENPAVLDEEEEEDLDDDVDLVKSTEPPHSPTTTASVTLPPPCHNRSVSSCSLSQCPQHHRQPLPNSHSPHHQHHFNHHNQLVNSGSNHHLSPSPGSTPGVPPSSLDRKSPSNVSSRSQRTVSPLFPHSTTPDDVHQVERFLNGSDQKHLNALVEEEALLLKEIQELESEQQINADADGEEDIDEELIEFQRIEREIKLSEHRKCLQLVQKQIQSYRIRLDQQEDDQQEQEAMNTAETDQSLLNERCQLDQAQQQVEQDITMLLASRPLPLAPLAVPETDAELVGKITPNTLDRLELSDSDESDTEEPATAAVAAKPTKSDAVTKQSLDDLLYESIENRLDKVNDLSEQEQESFVVAKPETPPVTVAAAETSTPLTRHGSQYDNERMHDCRMKHFGYQRNVDMLMLKSVYQRLELDKCSTPEMTAANGNDDGKRASTNNIMMMNSSSISNEMLESTTTATDSETDSIVLRRRSARFPDHHANGSSNPNLLLSGGQQSQDELSTHSDQAVLRNNKRNLAISNSSNAVGSGTGSQRPLTLYMPAPNQKINLITHLHALGHDLTSSIVTNHLLLTPYTCSGYLYKHCSRGVGKWRKRYFHFDRVRKVFVYYHDRSDFEKMRHPKRGVFFDEIQDVYVDHTRINMKKFLSQTNDSGAAGSGGTGSGTVTGSPGAMTTPAKPDGTRCVFVVSTATFSRKFILSTYTPELMRIWMDVIFTGAQAYLQDFDDQMN